MTTKNTIKRLVLAVSFVLTIAFSTLPLFAQCGTYFQSDYRAVGKIWRGWNGSNFRLADWNGDGRSDFWNFRRNDATNTSDVVIYPALPTGYWNWDAPITLTTTLPIQMHTDASTYILRDFDSDGKMDIYAGSVNTSQNTRIHRNTGTALMPLALIQGPAGGSPTSWLGYRDLTGDGLLDWVYTFTPAAGGLELSYSPGTVDGAFGARVSILTHTAENELDQSYRFIADLDGDGDLDIGYSAWTNPNYRVRVLRNNGGTFVLGSPFATPVSFSSALDFADYNGDGRVDLMTYVGGATVHFTQPDMTWISSPTQPYSIPSPNPARVVDFNNDGRRDLILSAPDNTYEILYYNGDGTYTSKVFPVQLKDRFPSITMHFEDFNNDGKADAWETTHETINTFNEEVVVIRSNVCTRKGATRTFNFNGDYFNDVATWNPSNGEWRTKNAEWLPGPPYPPTMTLNWGLGSLGDVPAAGDFDGDGKTDHTVYRNSEGNWYSYLSATGSWSVVRFGLAGDVPIPNDYNGGGKTDYAVFRPADGNWYVWYNETQQFSIIHWGTNGDRPVPADYDGDGKTDLAVFRPSSGEWFTLRSSDSGYSVTNWGIETDVPLPADYDGDGKADITVYRSGIWYILRSHTGTSAVFPWGNPGDIPMPLTRDGETFVPSIYRPSIQRYYTLNRTHVLSLEGPPFYFGLPNN